MFRNNPTSGSWMTAKFKSSSGLSCLGDGDCGVESKEALHPDALQIRHGEYNRNPVLLPILSKGVEMNKTLETIRGSWITRDREAAEANRDILHNSLEKIPTGLRDKFLSILDWAERTEQWSDIIIDGACRDSDRRLDEIIIVEAQMKGLNRSNP